MSAETPWWCGRVLVLQGCSRHVAVEGEARIDRILLDLSWNEEAWLAGADFQKASGGPGGPWGVPLMPESDSPGLFTPRDPHLRWKRFQGGLILDFL